MVKIAINTALLGDHPLTPRLTWLSVPIFVIFRPVPSRAVLSRPDAPGGFQRTELTEIHFVYMYLQVLTTSVTFLYDSGAYDLNKE